MVVIVSGQTFGSARLIFTLLFPSLLLFGRGVGGPISNPSLRLSFASSGCVGKYLLYHITFINPDSFFFFFFFFFFLLLLGNKETGSLN